MPSERSVRPRTACVSIMYALRRPSELVAVGPRNHGSLIEAESTVLPSARNVRDSRTNPCNGSLSVKVPLSESVTTSPSMPRRYRDSVTVCVAPGAPIEVVTRLYPRHWFQVRRASGVNWLSS